MDEKLLAYLIHDLKIQVRDEQAVGGDLLFVPDADVPMGYVQRLAEGRRIEIRDDSDPFRWALICAGLMEMITNAPYRVTPHEPAVPFGTAIRGWGRRPGLKPSELRKMLEGGDHDWFEMYIAFMTISHSTGCVDWLQTSQFILCDDPGARARMGTRIEAEFDEADAAWRPGPSPDLSATLADAVKSFSAQWLGSRVCGCAFAGQRRQRGAELFLRRLCRDHTSPDLLGRIEGRREPGCGCVQNARTVEKGLLRYAVRRCRPHS